VKTSRGFHQQKLTQKKNNELIKTGRPLNREQAEKHGTPEKQGRKKLVNMSTGNY